MKKNLFIGALTLLAMVSCSKDEIVDINRVNDEISFNVVANSSTRAVDVYCNNNLPSSFKVWAAYDGQTYIDGDEIVSADNNTWNNNSGTRYWPNEGSVDFYAHVNAGDAFKWSATAAPTIEDFIVPTNVAEQKDLLYAVQADATKGTGETPSPVTLNFRHAMSQIVFKAKNTNANLYVEIDGVKICNVGDKNTFTYPTKDTDDNIEDHDGTENVTIEYNDSWGSWVPLTVGAQTYPVTFTAVPVHGDNKPVDLTSKNDDNKEFSSNAMLLLPQTTTAWNVNNAPKPDASGQTGSYFLVKCLIYNVAGDQVDKTKDVCLWGNKQTDGTYIAKEVAIPVKLEWEQGKKYIYTFLFGKGNGGYDPNPDDPTKPDPVLVPITFDVTVDDFIPVVVPEIETGL